MRRRFDDVLDALALNQRRQHALEDRLGEMPVSDTQQLQDELAARTEICEVKNTIRYCETLIR